ncbi:MAG: helicase-related protein [Candidatus Nanohalobium sp.]
MSDDVQYPGVMDNREWSVSDRANQYCAGAETVKVAVGYFYVAGFELLKESFADVDEVKLLIGRQTDEQTRDELVKGFADELDDVEQNEDTNQSVRHLYQLIQEDKVKVKIYTGSRFHPKLYYFDRGDIKDTAIVGSSNFSPSGLKGNVELNVEKNEPLPTNFLNNWFEELWEEADEFKKDLLEVVESSKFEDEAKKPVDPGVEGLISPKQATEMYIRNHFEREVEDGTLFEDIEGEYEDQLAEFQNDAVRAARYTLDRYNGVILSDSVGLGKTWIGSALAEEYSNPQSQELIIAPKRLHSMWEQTLNKEFNVQGEQRIISFQELSMMDADDIERFRDYDLILIDEAHKLRNQGSKRYSNIQNIGRKDKKYILLTATPVQNSATDLNNIIKIFADDDDFDINLYNDEEVSDIFKAYQKESLKDDPDEAKMERLKEDIERIMREVVISRTRDYIMDNYDNVMIGDREIKTPDRKPKLIPPESDDMKVLYSEIIDIVAGRDDQDDEGLNLPYVGVQRYGDAETDEFEIQYRNAGALITILLFKRLESSLAAFQQSIHRLKEREKAIKEIASGDVNSPQKRQEVMDYFEERDDEGELEDVDIDEVIDAVENLDRDERKEITTDVDEDLIDLKELEDKAEEFIHEDGTDAKVEQLKDLLNDELDDEKVLIFTQYVPTAEYIFEKLTGNTGSSQIGQFEDKKIGYVHGDSFKREVVTQFAPNSQGAQTGLSDEDVDVLITTDVLSVGQNLQDARVVVNYDLHWNPMKMEQRIGRIDRITTEHDELLIYNFIPTQELDDTLGLLERIRRKIEDISNTFGKEAPILEDAEDRVEKNLIIYDKVQEDGSEFSEEDFEKAKSKYDQFRSQVKEFCEENNIDLGDLKRISALEDESRVASNFDADEEAYMVMAHLEFTNGTEDVRSIITRNEFGMETYDIDGQRAITNLPIDEDDEAEIFDIIKSNRPDKNPDIEEAREIEDILTSPTKWNKQVLDIENSVPDDLNDLYNYCSEIKDDSSYSKEIREKAQDIVDNLDNYKLTDYYIKELRNIYRYRRNYEDNSLIEHVWEKMQNFEMISPRKVKNVDIKLIEKV